MIKLHAGRVILSSDGARYIQCYLWKFHTPFYVKVSDACLWALSVTNHKED